MPDTSRLVQLLLTTFSIDREFCTRAGPLRSQSFKSRCELDGNEYQLRCSSYPNNLFDAIAAPSRIALSFAHTTSSAIVENPTVVSKPQSVAAIIR
jgi:hypothetical protein